MRRMKGDDLRNWLAVLGIGGGLVIAGQETVEGVTLDAFARSGSQPPRAERAEGPVYVVINHEEQYSIWPAPEKVPRGWRILHERFDIDGAVRRFPRIGDQRFRVVINHEEQYSIWPQDRRPPRGYKVPEAMKGRGPCRIDECGRLVKELEEGGGSR